MIHDKLGNWKLYFDSDPWRCAFEYLESLSPESDECERFHLKGDDIYAAIMSYKTCSTEESVLETHDKYIDIQMSLVNAEAIDLFYRDNLKVKIPYDINLDRTFYYRPDVAYSRIVNLARTFSVLFSHDAHMPMLMVHEKPEHVKKVVVKVLKSLVF